MVSLMIPRLICQMLPKHQCTAALHASAVVNANPTPNGRVTCTLIPGDGVGPEIMDAAQEVLQSMGAKIDFEEMHLSEIHRGASRSLEDVMASVQRNKVCLERCNWDP
eukprot:TRINITY_DN12683_c0_g1_i1.p1 TRINITY_DN12683_c0_g1~~TRINITY_DN12683_c0_g1_i1.p1  ORF type:complete len:108 (-),score=8.35 TRINITY_DN12683_c0_g1_i1:317-640(-)